MVRPSPSLALALALAPACTTQSAADTGLVQWAGYVYTGPQADVLYSTTTDAAATVSFVPDGAADGGDGAAGDSVTLDGPYAASEPGPAAHPGYWSVKVPPSTPFTIRLSTSPGAVWRATSPTVNASWFAGALFGADGSEVDALLTALGAPARGTDSIVIGKPWDTGWDCANVRVDGVVPACFLVDSAGSVSPVTTGDLSYFVSSPVVGPTTTVTSGLGATETYALDAGDVAMAYWFTGNAIVTVTP